MVFQNGFLRNFYLSLVLLFSYSSFADELKTIQPANLNTLLALQADKQAGSFTQSRYLSALDRPLVSEGNFSFEKHKALNWNIDTPFEIQYHYDGKQLSQIEFGQTSIIKLKDDPMLIGFFSFFFEIMHGDIEEIQRLFSHTISQTEDGKFQLTLAPKKRFLEKSFRDIVIRVSEKQIQQVQINESDTDKIVLNFHFSGE